jgi:hypothetical protein
LDHSDPQSWTWILTFLLHEPSSPDSDGFLQ